MRTEENRIYRNGVETFQKRTSKRRRFFSTGRTIKDILHKEHDYCIIQLSIFGVYHSDRGIGMRTFKESLEQSKKQLYLALAATFIWGIWTHGYGFLHDSFSKDSLSEFYGAAGGSAWKIQLGRVIVPIYRQIFRTELTLPWMVGLLSLLWIGLAVYLTARIFKVQSKLSLVLIAGIFTANITVAATAASYSHDYDCDMFAMLCSVCAVYCWKDLRFGWLIGAVFVAISLGIYQSYISVAIVLVMFVCILALLDGELFLPVLGRGLKAVGMLLLGGVIYYILMRSVLAATGITLASGDTNSLDSALTLSVGEIIYLTYHAYADCVSRLLNVVSPYPAALVRGITLVLMIFCAGILVWGLCRRKLGWLERLLCMGLIALIPLGMNLIYIPTHAIVHDLMVYAIWLFYLLVVLLGDWFAQCHRNSSETNGEDLRKQPRKLSMALLAVLLYGNMQTANVLYLKKDMEQDAYLSLMTRIVYRMETFDEYEPGVTPVVFVGEHTMLNDCIPGFEPYTGITGMDTAVVATTGEDYRLRSYFQTVMNIPVVVPGGDVYNAMKTDPAVAAMPAYPEEGCIALLDGVLVVKLS